MAGVKRGLTYFSDVVSAPLPGEIQPGHKALFTMNPGVFVADSSGNIVRLDDYQLVQDVSGALSAVISGQAVQLLQGNIGVSSGQVSASIAHTAISLTAAYPIVSLKGPDASSIIYPLSITNRSTTGFDVVLAGAPDTTGYSIDWFMAAGGASVAGSGGGGGGGGPGTIGVTGAGTYVTDVSTIEFAGSALASVQDQGSGKIKVTVDAGAGGVPGVVSETGNSFSPDGLDDVYDYTLTDNADINCPSAMPNGATIIIKFTQPASSTATISFNNTGGLTWKFSNGNVPVLTASPGAIDILSVVRIGTDVYVTIIKNFL